VNTHSYDHDGLIGCATPQANRTVEAELRRLLPTGVNLQMSRSVASGTPRTRLLSYFRRLEDALASYGGMPLEAFGLGCTASSYLLEPGEERRHTDALSRTFSFPVCTAAQAVQAALGRLGVQRLLIGSPYPDWIHQACVAYWQEQGFTVVAGYCAAPAMEDTSEIYDLDSQQLGQRLQQALGGQVADALLITGTGLPTLALRPTLQSGLAMPVLSANVCLAWYLLHLARPDGDAARVLARELEKSTAAA